MNRAKVLVIDDESCIRSLLKDILPSCTVMGAATGKEAMLQVDNDSFDIIFCDLKMPDISGIDLYQYIAKQHPELATRIVFMTGGAFTVDVQQFLHETAHPVIQKPFDLATIRNIVATYAAMQS